MKRLVAPSCCIALLLLLGCDPASGPGPGTQTPTATKSAKRGIAYDLATPEDLAALSPGVSWWYN